MIRNYLKIALRNIVRFKLFSFINIFGLAIGIASSILIFLFVQNELGYDSFHKNADDIYLVQKYRHTAVGLKVLNDTWIPLLPKLKSDYPEVENGTRLFEQNVWVQTSNNQKFRENVTFADPSIFSVFTFPLKSGNKETVFKDKYSLVISQEIADKYFGKENPIGKRLKLDFGENEYIITGILKKIPSNSTISTSIIAPFGSAVDENDPQVQNNWNGAFLYTYLKLKNGSSSEDLENQLPTFVKNIWGEDGPNGSKQLDLKLLPLTDLHNDIANTRTFAYILICIAIVILLIASVNYINLAISRSLERAKEIGMRKVLGAGKSHLIWQYLGESIFLSFLSLLIGIGISEILLPVMNRIYDLNISHSYFSDPSTLLILSGICLAVGIFSGIYPALVLSKFRTLDSLSGELKTSKGGVFFRNVLVTVQFSLSIILVAGTVIIWQQTNFMKEHNTNFQKENIVVLPVSLGDFADSKTAVDKIELFKNELKSNSNIVGVTSSMSVPGNVTDANVFATPEDWKSPEPLRMRITANDEDFFSIYNIDFLEGRNFSKDMSTDKDDAIILNESAMKDMGWRTAVGKKVKIGRTLFNVIGVVKDYNTESLEVNVRPLIHFYRTTESSAPRFISVKYSSVSPESILTFLKDKWRILDPERSFDYFFVDKQYDQLYANQSRMVTVVGYFSILAIIIASLGLFGLLAFNIVQRRKEIGIRKVLGSSVSGILFLLTKKYLALILIANLIAWPLTFYLMNQWLQDFAYKISPGILTLLFASIVVLIIASITLSIQAIKAASAD
ncbi:MAG TPA: ABC transporter permease, partial [Ignavibacteriaceae bacterium]|nr:ABC transporter permease [Ignavibacteriaceae bacterium]